MVLLMCVLLVLFVVYYYSLFKRILPMVGIRFSIDNWLIIRDPVFIDDDGMRDDNGVRAHVCYYSLLLLFWLIVVVIIRYYSMTGIVALIILMMMMFGIVLVFIQWKVMTKSIQAASNDDVLCLMTWWRYSDVIVLCVLFIVRGKRRHY